MSYSQHEVSQKSMVTPEASIFNVVLTAENVNIPDPVAAGNVNWVTDKYSKTAF